MNVNMQDLDPVARYRLMIQSIIPRPVAWVLSENENDGHNLAPFSYFNAVHSHPPLIMMSIGYKRDKSKKDTRVNIERSQKFVVHIASSHLAAKVTESSLAFDYGVSEVEKTGLELHNEWTDFPLPRLKDAKIAMACKLDQVIEVGKNKQGLIFGEIEKMYIADDIVTQKEDNILIDAMKLDPLARLGGDDYGSLGNVFTIDRPEYKPH